MVMTGGCVTLQPENCVRTSARFQDQMLTILELTQSANCTELLIVAFSTNRGSS
ncbi:hypothetical protein J6590_083119 [Homalodisca vitripennis]|nr:hypothetical protein J6590_083119 [Homalodisca vitripennis]